MLYTTIMTVIIGILIIAIGGAIYYLSRLVNSFIADWRRRQDKEWMRLAIDREEYLNSIYEEVLCEKIDDIANETAKQMIHYGKR